MVPNPAAFESLPVASADVRLPEAGAKAVNAAPRQRTRTKVSPDIPGWTSRHCPRSSKSTLPPVYCTETERRQGVARAEFLPSVNFTGLRLATGRLSFRRVVGGVRDKMQSMLTLAREPKPAAHQLQDSSPTPRMGVRDLGRWLLILVAYGAAFTLLRSASGAWATHKVFSVWFPAAGLRFAFLWIAGPRLTPQWIS